MKYLPVILLIVVTVIFLIWERVWPGRKLPFSAGWYVRSLALNLIQLLVSLSIGFLWQKMSLGFSLLNFASFNSPVLGGFVGWFIGTFVFYWWHRLRHQKGFWLLFHQIHHSASRIEVLTSFYKHPLEMIVNSILTGIILFPILGVSLLGSAWYNFFAATGEYFYHANIKTPKWLRYFIQTPELHSIHHKINVHRHNYGDLTIWDRLFGTYFDTTEFAERCGFPEGAEEKISKMLLFEDVYKKN